MDQIIQFITHHWTLWVGLVVVVALIAIDELRGKMSSTKQVTPQQATMMMNAENALVLDIRKPEDFEKGHIIGALNVPFAEFETKLKSLQKYVSKPIVVSCYRGKSSLKAAEMLKKASFSNVMSMAGGMASWVQEGYPTER